MKARRTFPIRRDRISEIYGTRYRVVLAPTTKTSIGVHLAMSSAKKYAGVTELKSEYSDLKSAEFAALCMNMALELGFDDQYCRAIVIDKLDSQPIHVGEIPRSQVN